MQRDELVNKIVSSPVYSRDSGLVRQLATALRNKLSMADLDQLLVIIGTKTNQLHVMNGAVYAGSTLMGEYDGYGDDIQFVPSKALLECDAEYQQKVHAFAKGNMHLV